MLRVYVSGVGVLAPGLDGWQKSRSILVGEFSYAVGDCSQPRPTILPPTERRRASATVRLAVQVAQEAIKQSGLPADDLATVFASADGDTEILGHLCNTLAQPEKAVSPTRFHNSVHNAPAGYWSIATGSTAPSNSLSCYDATFAGGLLDAACQAIVEDRPVLLSTYDITMPDPLSRVRAQCAPFGSALVLDVRQSATTLAKLDIELDEQGDGSETTLPTPELEVLRRANAAARALPVLAAIASGRPTQIVLKYVVGSSLRVKVAS